jgi:hypothetical protein
MSFLYAIVSFENDGKHHTLLMGVYIILALFSTFFAHVGKKFGTRDIHKNLLNEHEYCGIVCSENNTLLRGIIKFLSLHSTFIDQFR